MVALTCPRRRTTGAGGSLTITAYGGYNLTQAGSYNLIDAASFSGDLSSVTVGGTSLTLNNGIWTGTATGTTYSFAEGTGVLAVVPEPSTWTGAALALLAIGYSGRKRFAALAKRIA